MAKTSNSLSGFNVGILRSRTSDCCCHETVIEACARFRMKYWLADSEALPENPAECAILFDTTEHFLDHEELRWYPRAWAQKHNLRIAGDSSTVVRLCDDKVAVRSIFKEAGIPVPAGLVLAAVPSLSMLERLLEQKGISFPVVVKSAAAHGSLGLSVVENLNGIAGSVASCLALGKGLVIIEEYIEGKELQLPLFLSWTKENLPLMELKNLDGIYDAERKSYSNGEVQYVPAKLAIADNDRLCSLAVQSCQLLGIQSYVRFDIRQRHDGSFCFLEANIKPSLHRGFCLDMAFKAIGADITDGLYSLIEQALLGKPAYKP